MTFGKRFSVLDEDTFILEDFEEAINNLSAAEKRFQATFEFQILIALYYIELILCSPIQIKPTTSTTLKLLNLIERIPEVEKIQ